MDHPNGDVFEIDTVWGRGRLDLMTNSEVFEDLMNSWFTTRQLAGYALCFREYNTPYARPLWEGIAGTEFEAREYYRSLDDETLRFEACTILINGGWTRQSLALKNS